MTDDSSVSKTEESVKKKSLPFVDNFGDENQTIADYEAFMDEGEYDAKIYQTLDVTFLESVSKENPLGKIIKESKDNFFFLRSCLRSIILNSSRP